ncbi:MAG TPA: TrmB family transcriptional regulator [Candidatus Nanopusillus sp.]|nr:TrmB family transcriptional regulator [Candidatus Nanopusillus sp.]HIP90575.1 TrmB family transcriptional regulator [Candidatus Nanopusillus sp.]
MVIREDLITKVKQIFGLNTYEAKVWLALLAKGVATAGEISDLAEVPRSRTYDVLESLEKKGFVIAKLGKPIKYIAVPPKDILARLRKKYEEEMKYKLKLLEDLKQSEIIQELETIHQSGVKILDITEKSGAIRGRHNIYGHLETMFKGAEEDIYIMTTDTAFIRKIDTFKNLFLELKDRGVKIKVITPINEANARYVRDMLEVAEIYDAGDLRGRVIIVDKEEVMLMLFDDKEVHATNDIAIWVYAPFVARAIASLIDKVIPQLKPAKEKLEELGL